MSSALPHSLPSPNSSPRPRTDRRTGPRTHKLQSHPTPLALALPITSCVSRPCTRSSSRSTNSMSGSTSLSLTLVLMTLLVTLGPTLNDIPEYYYYLWVRTTHHHP